MKYEELLAKLDNRVIDEESDTNNYLALRAVVELHKPITIELCDDLDCCGCGNPDFICNDCQSNEYPCPTIQAIIKELN